ncbi:hypothetical protein SLEP1_g9671 [Rubroshorea leprosula]|uniref:Uncharacterized protein n=1 Tax=Rubroshorea leprosula TaxID=152421 RepID=A0AAV5IFJ5_9ROSI|nr:hypothetical protein SLEP1_g9671 [Rubroshorea leprosula]
MFCVRNPVCECGFAEPFSPFFYPGSWKPYAWVLCVYIYIYM